MLSAIARKREFRTMVSLTGCVVSRDMLLSYSLHIQPYGFAEWTAKTRDKARAMTTDRMAAEAAILSDEARPRP
jgi:hypothetical protein